MMEKKEGISVSTSWKGGRKSFSHASNILRFERPNAIYPFSSSLKFWCLEKVIDLSLQVPQYLSLLLYTVVNREFSQILVYRKQFLTNYLCTVRIISKLPRVSTVHCTYVRIVYCTTHKCTRTVQLRARLDCLTKPSNIMHLTKTGLSKLQNIDLFTK